LQAIQKYRRMFGEVLLASFFLQLLALATPLFFQVVTDKVLVHRGFSTLDVLVIGLTVVSIFEVGLGGLRTYIFAHTTNRIVVGSFPVYIVISAAATPVFHRWLEEKFERGAENQAFLVEAVSGMQTLKAMAVEPQMQRRWEEQLAGYVQSSFRVLSLGNVAC